MQRILYENTDGSIAIIIPADEAVATYGLPAIAKKDTPTGLPYWIIDASIIPVDRRHRHAWRLDGTEGVPDGYGGELNVFDGGQ